MGAAIQTPLARVNQGFPDSIIGGTLSRRIEPDAIYKAGEGATLVGLHVETLREKLRAGIVAGKRKGGGDWRIKGSELLKLA